MDRNSCSNQLDIIEGLRGYLALWVMTAHIFVFGAYIKIPSFFHQEGNNFLNILDMGSLAVGCFIIISGFVIFLLIDTKKEKYSVYITRRFLRIFPVYFLLFLVSIPCQWIAGESLEMTKNFQSAESIRVLQTVYDSHWLHFWYHFMLHLTMLHGLIPTNILQSSSCAFLGPAWSLSLEWQFYLIAPIWYALYTSNKLWKKMLTYGLGLIFIFKGHQLFNQIQNGSIVFFNFTYFFTGIASYFFYKKMKGTMIKKDIILPTSILLLLGIYRFSDKTTGLIPFVIWGIILALIFEPQDSLSSRFVRPIFTNSILRWLGKISYSVYLSHALVLCLVQFVVLKLFPNVSQNNLLIMLLIATPIITFTFSDYLYRTIELPFINYGKSITRNLQ